MKSTTQETTTITMNTDSEKLEAVFHDEVSLGHVIDSVKEKELVRKLDLWLLPVLTLAYIGCFVDRASVGNARIMGMSKDLNLVGYQFNIVRTFLVSCN